MEDGTQHSGLMAYGDEIGHSDQLLNNRTDETGGRVDYRIVEKRMDEREGRDSSSDPQSVVLHNSVN